MSQKFLNRGDEVIGVDTVNDYYDRSLKEARVSSLEKHENFSLARVDISDREGIKNLFAKERPGRVVNLAAQAGVRYSVENPHVYASTNLLGFTNVLQACKENSVGHLAYASSSTVYGAGTKLPFSVDEPTEHPVSLYGATKRANELMAHAYSHLFSIPTTGMRFFTVYGPWGRPDLAIFKFVRNILAGEPIDLYNQGKNSRDFVYIDDLVDGITRILDRPASPDPDWDGNNPSRATSNAPSRIYNIGSGRQVGLVELVELIEACLGKKAKVRMCGEQPGDVTGTHADIEATTRDLGYKPQVPIEEGIKRFVDWFKEYHTAD